MPTGKPLLVTFVKLPVFVKVTSRVNNVLFKKSHAKPLYIMCLYYSRKVQVKVLRGN